MQYQFNINLTENDYMAYNHVHALETAYGRKQVLKSRIVMICLMAFLAAVYVFVLGWDGFTASCVTAMALFTVIYMIFFKKILKRNITKQIKKLKATGKLPFESTSTLEFYDDKLVEISAKARSEQSYDTLERICVMKDQYIFLYQSSITAILLPVPQLRAKADLNEFLNFLSAKCSKIEHY